MGRKGNKKFIEKGEGQKFHLLHRSQRDAAYANEENPSDFVLVPADQVLIFKLLNQIEFKLNIIFHLFCNTSSQFRGERQRTSKGSSLASISGATGSHINELGFANDGYDYSQHLRDAGT